MTGLERGPLLYPYRSSNAVTYRNCHWLDPVSGCRHSTISSFANRGRNPRWSPAMAGDAYPVPLANSHTSGGGSVRLSLVSVDTALCSGPRNAAQSWVTASFGSGFGFLCTRVCPNATPAPTAWAISAWNIERREIDSIALHPSTFRPIRDRPRSWMCAARCAKRLLLGRRDATPTLQVDAHPNAS